MASVAPTLYHEEGSIVDHSLTGRNHIRNKSLSRPFGSVTTLGAAIAAVAGMSPVSATPTEVQPSFHLQGQSDFFVDERALLIDDLRQYEMLEPGWDGGSNDVAPSRDAIDEAIQFVENIPPFIVLPEAMVSNDGEVGLFWNNNDFYLDVGFRGCGECSFFGKSGEVKVKGRGKTGKVGPVPTELFDFFMLLTNDVSVLV